MEAAIHWAPHDEATGALMSTTGARTVSVLESFGDFFAFVNDFFCDGKDCRATDFNGDGVENSSDYFAFVIAFFAGCP